MENARAKGGLTLGSSIFAVEVSVWWPYPGRGVQFAASPGRRTLQAGFSRGWRGWTPPHARLAKRGEKAGEEEPVTVAQNLLILGSCSTVVTCSGRIGTRWGGGRSQALLTVRRNGQSCATLGSAVSMIVVEGGGHGPWPRALGRHRALKH